jgi:hypothetical protein
MAIGLAIDAHEGRLAMPNRRLSKLAANNVKTDVVEQRRVGRAKQRAIFSVIPLKNSSI